MSTEAMIRPCCELRDGVRHAEVAFSGALDSIWQKDAKCGANHHLDLM